MKTIYLKSTGLYWIGLCEISKNNSEIYLTDIFNWQKQGYKIEVVNGIFGEGTPKTFEEL